jgi:hypothetical protein
MEFIILVQTLLKNSIVILGDIPVGLVIDWEATWKQNLYYDFDFVDGYVFSSSF